MEISRLADDPAISKPNVKSFSIDDAIEITWEKDLHADEFILYRASDRAHLDFLEIYRGIEPEFIDTEGSEGEIYLYSLAKVRGEKEFDKSSSVIGVFSKDNCDSLEPNNIEEDATLIGSEFVANLYNFQSVNGLRETDIDWYRISLQGNTSASIVLSQLYELADGEDTGFLYSVDNGSVSEVLNNMEIVLANSSDEEREFLFKLYPDPVDFLPAAGISGGAFRSYLFSLN